MTADDWWYVALAVHLMILCVPLFICLRSCVVAWRKRRAWPRTAWEQRAYVVGSDTRVRDLPPGDLDMLLSPQFDLLAYKNDECYMLSERHVIRVEQLSRELRASINSRYCRRGIRRACQRGEKALLDYHRLVYYYRDLKDVV